MFKYGIRLITVLAAITLLPGSLSVSAETWRLDKEQGFKAVSAQSQDKYLLAVAQIKQMINTGQSKGVSKALNQLKKDFPEIAGPDLDAFIKAEVLFSRGKLVKAVRGYDKFLAKFPESELYEAALDREFAIATAFLAGQKIPVLKIFRIRGYEQGEKVMEKITDRAGNAPIGIKAALAVARSQEKRRKYNDAYLKWSQISSRWPTGQTGKDALLGMARCKHAAYIGPKYDASGLVSAKSYYENFKARYTKDAEELGIDEILRQINEQLAYKQFSIAQFYQKSGNKPAANLYYQMVIDNWPDSTAAKMTKTAMNQVESDSKKGKKCEKSFMEQFERLFL